MQYNKRKNVKCS